MEGWFKKDFLTTGGKSIIYKRKWSESGFTEPKGAIFMFVLNQNFLLWVCVAIVGGVIGFVIYGCIKGFENIFPDA